MSLVRSDRNHSFVKRALVLALVEDEIDRVDRHNVTVTFYNLIKSGRSLASPAASRSGRDQVLRR